MTLQGNNFQLLTMCLALLLGKIFSNRLMVLRIPSHESSSQYDLQR
jgi:hypothetical protein